MTIRTLTFFPFFLAMILFSCSDAGKDSKANEAGTISNDSSSKEGFSIQILTSGLDHPWGMDFLPDGRLLITERSGSLRILNSDNSLSDEIPGVPEVFAKGQGGLLDVAVDPDFGSNQFVFFSFAEEDEEGNASTALGRGVFENDQIRDFKVIFRMLPKTDGANHFGSRIVFGDNDHLFLTLAERFKFDPAQDLGNHLGTIIRIKKDGSIPADNPFVDKEGAKPEIWTYGHRNIQAAARDPESGYLWVAEMGPKGGDELNLIEKGENYGWPLVSHGEHYDGKDIPDHNTRSEFKDAALTWTPVIAPSGMIFYNGSMFPNWKGDMFIGGLMAQGIVRVEVNGKEAREVERINLDDRTRDVIQAPDGSIYAITDEGNGKVVRVFKK